MNPRSCSPTCLNRRQFIASSGALAVGAAAAPLVLSSTGCSDAGSAPGLKADFSIALSSKPELGPDGGAVSIQPNESGYEYQIWIRNEGGGAYRAWSSYCNHEGCEADWDGARFDCPCHGARWNAEGKLTSGPATDDLLEFNTQVDGDTLTVLKG